MPAGVGVLTGDPSFPRRPGEPAAYIQLWAYPKTGPQTDLTRLERILCDYWAAISSLILAREPFQFSFHQFQDSSAPAPFSSEIRASRALSKEA